jgi:putative cell wall-binding protein
MKRIAGGVTALALTAVGSLALAPSASAAVVVKLQAGSSKTVVSNDASQPAGDIKLVDLTSADTDDVVLQVADSSGDPCDADTFVAFSAVPTFPTDKVASATLQSSGGDCAVNNQLKLVLKANAAVPEVVLSNVKYTVGSDVAPGAVALSVLPPEVDADVLSNNSNATIAVVDRVEGANRFATAAKLADQVFDCKSEVLLANGRNFPDALAANYLAGVKNVPLVLTEPTALSPEARDAIKKFGATKVTIIGGPDAIAPAVATALQNQVVGKCPGTGDADGSPKLAVSRIEGTTRYDTARKVALDQGADAVGTLDPSGPTCTASEKKKTAILTTGQNFADALAIGPLAFQGTELIGDCGDGKAIPILLTEPNSLYSSIPETLTTLGVENVIVLGGQVAVTDATVGALITAKPGVSITRIEGANRQETARNIAKGLVARGFDSARTYIARGDDFPDALASGQVAGTEGATLVLENNPNALGTNVTDWIKVDTKAFVNHASLIGGPVALSQAVLGEVQSAFRART